MVENMLENGIIIICMEEEYILGKMVESMMDIIIMIKNMDLVFINGQMVYLKNVFIKLTFIC
jgi:hypothetical protein